MPEARAALRGHEIAWLADPLDALVLQIQGSGRVRITEPDGSQRLVRLAYAASNEHPYRSDDYRYPYSAKIHRRPHTALKDLRRVWVQVCAQPVRSWGRDGGCAGQFLEFASELPQFVGGGVGRRAEP